MKKQYKGGKGKKKEKFYLLRKKERRKERERERERENSLRTKERKLERKKDSFRIKGRKEN